jgi:hypothetical protein
MKRIYQFIAVLVTSLALFLNIGLNQVQAASHSKKDLMITSLENSGMVYAGQEARYTVVVDAIDSAEPKKSMTPYNEANVAVYFKNGSTVLQSIPKPIKNGRYTGTITLPDQGPWDVLVTSLRHGEKEAKDGSNVYTMTTQWGVHPPEKRGGAWLYGIGLVILLLVVYTLIIRIRHSNQKKGSKELD